MKRVEWILVSVMAVILIYAGYQVSVVNRMQRQLMVRRTGEGLRLSSMTDGPYLVTHLYHPERKATAALVPPIVIVDSGGAAVSAAQLKELEWVDLFGEPSSAPPVGADLCALYVEQKVAKSPTDDGR